MRINVVVPHLCGDAMKYKVLRNQIRKGLSIMWGLGGKSEQNVLGGYYRILHVSERFLSLILLGGEILRATAEITSSQSWDYRLRSQKEQLLGKAECLANCSICIGLL